MSLPLGTAGQVLGTNSGATAITNLTAFVQGSSGSNGIVTGTNTNDSAAAGKVGEYISGTDAGSASPTTTQYGDATSISLTAGDWDLSFVCSMLRNGSGWSTQEIGISTTSGNSSTGLVHGDNWLISTVATDWAAMTISGYRVSLTSTTTIYAKVSATYTGATSLIFGRLSARRVR